MAKCEICDGEPEGVCSGLEVPELAFCRRHLLEHEKICPDVQEGKSAITDWHYPSDDFWKQFRSPQEKDQDEHCLNCGIELFDDDEAEPYQRGYCRGCQCPNPHDEPGTAPTCSLCEDNIDAIKERTVEKLDAAIVAIQAFENLFTQMFRVK